MEALSLLVDPLGEGLTQTRRLLRLHTPLGPDRLFAEDIELWEGIGPMNGPALGDETETGSSMRPNEPARSPFDAALGPTRAGLRLVVHALAGDAQLELKTLVGQPALVELLCQESRVDLRPWHGHIVAAALMGSDGGLARYRLVIEPWLAALAHAVDAWVFQDRSVPQIIDAVFEAHVGNGPLVPAWRWDLAAAYPKRSLCVQYHESDLDFVLRLMREEGLFCWWEHTGDAASATLGTHTLVIADHNGSFATNVQPRVRFTASDHTLEADSLTRWTNVARVTSTRVAMRSLDYRSLGARLVEASTGSGSACGAPAVELAIVDVPGAYAYEDVAQGQRLANRQAEALAAVRTRGLARGPWRRAQVATRFTLVDHPRHAGADAARDDFVVLAAQHRARNDFLADQAARFVGSPHSRATRPRRDDAAPLHESALLVQPSAVPVRLGATDPAPWTPFRDGCRGVFGHADGERRVDAFPSLFDPLAHAALGQPEVRLHLRPTVHGVQTAIVVGDGDGDLHTDRDARIRVQFHWQRGGASSHRLGAPGRGDNAPASSASFTWVRVGSGLAGDNFGAVFTPRIGQEVLVAFTGGDIDRPVVVGVLYNGRGAPDAPGNQVAGGAAGASGNAPAWFPGRQAADRHEGHRHGAVMLGHKSQELGTSRSGTGGSNQLVFDDSATGNRIELGTTTEASRLQLGALLQQQDNQRLAPRGHGLELVSTAHGAIRAGAGLLVSAYRQAASTGVGQQLEAREPAALLEAAQGLVHALTGSSQAHNAQIAGEPQVAGAREGERGKQLPAGEGLRALAESLRGMASSQMPIDATADTRAPPTDGGHGSVAAWKRPDLVLAAPAGVGLFTPAAAVLGAGSHATFSAGHDLHSIAGGHHSVVAAKGVVLYTEGRTTDTGKPNAETGISLHAANGNVVASSVSGATRWTASEAIDVTSTSGKVLVASPRQVLLSVAGAAIRIESGNITIQAPGRVTFKAGMKVLTGGGHASVQFQQGHSGKAGPLEFNEVFVITNDAGAPLANRRYEIIREDGGVLRGVTDAQGRIQQQVSFKGERVRIKAGASA